jgi:hypothetical protein
MQQPSLFFRRLLVYAFPAVGAIHELPLHPERELPVNPEWHAEQELPEQSLSRNQFPSGNNAAIIPDSETIRKQRRIMTIPKIIGYYRMNVAKRINDLRGTPGVPVWQRNYFEHIIRNKQSLFRIRHYIKNNPEKLMDGYTDH